MGFYRSRGGIGGCSEAGCYIVEPLKLLRISIFSDLGIQGGDFVQLGVMLSVDAFNNGQDLIQLANNFVFHDAFSFNI